MIWGMQDERPPETASSRLWTIDGRLPMFLRRDLLVFGGSLSETNALKICKIMDLRLRNARGDRPERFRAARAFKEGVMSLSGYADIFLRNTLRAG